MSNVKPVPRTKQAWCQKYTTAIPAVKRVPQLPRVVNCNSNYQENWWER